MEGFLEYLFILGVAARDIVLSAAGLLRLPQSPGLFSLTLVALLAVLLLAFLRSVFRRRSLLEKATGFVRRYRDAETPRKNFDEVFTRMSAWKSRDGQHLAETWKEFQETTLEAKLGTGAIQNAIRPAVFFNLEDLGFGVSGWRFWPGLFVSIGLAATFLGLIAALQETGESLKAGGDQANVMMALTQLLTVASAKFIMSLTGLVCSIVFTVVLRVATRSLDHAMRALAHEIERGMRFVSLEDIAEQQLAVTIEQRDQSRRLNDELIAAISEPLQKAVGSSASQVDQMVSKLATSLSDGLVAAMTVTSDRLESASSKLAGLADEISAAAARFSSAAERTAVGLDGAAQRLEAVSEKLSNAGSELADAAVPMAHTATETASATRQIASASTEMVDAARTAMASEKDVAVTALNVIRDQIRTFEARAASYDGQLEKAFRSFSEEIARSVSEVENHSNSVHGQYADALATLQAVIENAKAFQPESQRPVQ
ncbi:methyl-accepting chemotaxis protein [Tianweitania sp.]|uniref:methyl-accepting chemotaxis protein n=1 Tax=Tianweitania sp. TaxID=2021634 RepID=UPI00289980A7|nr:methyl-accepting chemotaxis protein [Tianweitania sp.]